MALVMAIPFNICNFYPSSGKRMKSKQADKQVDKSKVWHWEDSLKSVEFLHSFLLLYSKLEKAKDDWACRKLGIPSFTTTKSYCNFMYVIGIYFGFI